MALARELLVISSAIAAGIAAVYVYQHSSELLPKAKAIFDTEADSSERKSTMQTTKGAAADGLGTPSIGSHPDIIPDARSTPASSSIGSVASSQPTIEPNTQRFGQSSAAAAALPASSSTVTKPPQPDSTKLVVDISQMLKDNDSNRWSNEGVMLWRDCRRLVTKASTQEPIPEVIEACNYLLTDALVKMRSAEGRQRQELTALAKELRADRAMLSAVQLRELDRIVSASRAAQNQASPASQAAASQATRK